jgi:predicted MFS family arabinose efflux permease
VRWSLVLGGTSFAVFTMFWTALTFLLSAPPFSFGVDAIGLFGLVGLAGALTAQRAGRLQDRGLGLATIGVAWAAVVVAFAVAGIGARSVVVLVVAVLLLDVAIQAHNITVQTRMFQVDPAARSRLNTAFVTNNFVWGALGSALAGVLWAHGGWTAVTVAGAVASGFALTVWAVGRRGPLRVG